MPSPRLLLLGLLQAAWLAAPVLGQALFLPGGDPADTAPTSRAAPRLETIGARARRTLTQFETLVTPPEEGDNEQGDDGVAWDEALDLLEDLLASDADGLIADEQEPGRYVSLRQHCHAIVSRLPDEGRRAYRERVDPAARRLFEEGRDNRDESTLRRVVDEYFASSWGDDALLLLGDLALERGDTTAARRCWRQVTRLASTPNGRPLAWALRGIDLNEQGAAVAEQMRQADSIGLTHADSDVPVGEILARFVLAELCDGDPAAANVYAAMLQQLAPDARGPLAGRSGLLADLADELIEEAKSWQAADEKKVGPLYGRSWPKPIPLQPVVQPQAIRRQPFLRGRLQTPQQSPAEPIAHCRPTVAAGFVVYRNAGALFAADLTTGAAALGPRGVLYQLAAVPTNGLRGQINGRARFNGRLPLRGTRFAAPLPTDERFAVQGDRLIVRVPKRLDNGSVQPAYRAFDLRREGLESPTVEPIDDPWRIGGAVTAGRDRLYAPLVASEITPRLALAAYSSATGRELWRTPIATGAAQSTFGPAPTPRVEATLAGDTVYLNTNVGAVAAVDATTGAIRWVRLYDGGPNSAQPLTQPLKNYGAAACVVAGGRVFVAPRDADRVFALDAATGRLLWAAEPIEGTFHLLGAAGRVLTVGGDLLRVLDVDTGRARFTWPANRKSGIRGMGHGCLVAGEVFWPTRNRLYVFDARTGAQTRPSIDIADLGGGGAYVVPAGKRLVVAGVKAMIALGPINNERKNNQPLLSQN